MKALVYTGDAIELADVAEPTIKKATDVVVRTRLSALGDTERMFSSAPEVGLTRGTVVGHQAVGEVVETGTDVRGVGVGDRVVLAATVACGACAYCKVGFYAQCVQVNPRGVGTGGAYLGGPAIDESLDGTSAPLIRVPYGDVGLRRVPDAVSDLAALHLSEQFAVAYFGTKLARICAGDRVAVIGSSPAAPFAALVAKLLGAGRTLLVGDAPELAEQAGRVGAENVVAPRHDFAAAIADTTDGCGVQCAVVTDGLLALDRASGPDAGATAHQLHAAVAALSRDSTLATVGAYPPGFDRFPIALATSKYVTIKAAACNHAKYLGPLLTMLEVGVLTGAGLIEAAPEPVDVSDAADHDGWTVVRW